MRWEGPSLAVAAGLALALGIPYSASASEVHVESTFAYDANLHRHVGEEISYSDVPGEDNAVSVSQSGSIVTVSDDVPLAAGNGCAGAADDPRIAFCHVGRLLTVSARFKDGADRLLSVPPVEADVRAGSGDDYIDASGSIGSDLVGGSGRDTLVAGRGSARIFGGGVDDHIVADHASRALVTCSDHAPEGSALVGSGALVKSCVSVQRQGVAAPEFTAVGQSDLDPDGVVRVGIGCSQDQAGGCRGVLTLKHVGRVLARRRFAVAPGSSRAYRSRAKLHAFTAPGCRTAHLVATLRTHDARGRPWRVSHRFAVGPLALACNLPSLELYGPDGGW